MYYNSALQFLSALRSILTFSHLTEWALFQALVPFRPTQLWFVFLLFLGRVWLAHQTGRFAHLKNKQTLDWPIITCLNPSFFGLSAFIKQHIYPFIFFCLSRVRSQWQKLSRVFQTSAPSMLSSSSWRILRHHQARWDIYRNPSSKFWVYPGVSSQLDMPETSKGRCPGGQFVRSWTFPVHPLVLQRELQHIGAQLRPCEYIHSRAPWINAQPPDARWWAPLPGLAPVGSLGFPILGDVLQLPIHMFSLNCS